MFLTNLSLSPPLPPHSRLPRPQQHQVMEQAYLYRVAAMLHLARLPLVENPSSRVLLAAQQRRRDLMFLRTLSEIESLRADTLSSIKKRAGVARLPTTPFADRYSRVYPLLEGGIKEMCDRFPREASAIAVKHELSPEIFDGMLAGARASVFKSWKLRRDLTRIKRGEAAARRRDVVIAAGGLAPGTRDDKRGGGLLRDEGVRRDVLPTFNQARESTTQ